jgi:hypothetical protein
VRGSRPYLADRDGRRKTSLGFSPSLGPWRPCQHRSVYEKKSGPCCANREYRGSAAAWVRSNTYQTTLPLLSRIGIPPPITGGGQRSCPVLTMADTLGAISPTSRAAARRARPGSSFPGLRCHPPPGGLPRDGQLLGLRCLTRDLRVHAEVVERARNNCQSDRACPDAARDRPLK